MKEEERLLLVNKEHPIDKTKIPNDLTITNVMFAVEKEGKDGTTLCFYQGEFGGIEGESGKRYLQREVAMALECLFMRGKQEGQYFAMISGYRSYERQQQLYEESVRKNGISHANQYSAKAGHSEHQTGLAVDISCETIGYRLEEIFEMTKEYRWLIKNCWKEGFIIRYPKGKEHITGYEFEPWHLRYVGREEAELIMCCQITLEEFLIRYKNRRRGK